MKLYTLKILNYNKSIPKIEAKLTGKKVEIFI